MSRLRKSTASGYQQDAGHRLPDPRPDPAAAHVFQEWFPTVNTWGGWYGRSAYSGGTRAAFIGERLAEPASKPWWPPLYGGISGTYIWRCVIDAGFSPHDMYYSNAIKQMGQREDLAEELQHEVLPDAVIALGGVASRMLWEQGVSHWKLPHPAFWKRFHFNERGIYIKILKEALGNG